MPSRSAKTKALRLIPTFAIIVNSGMWDTFDVISGIVV